MSIRNSLQYRYLIRVQAVGTQNGVNSRVRGRTAGGRDARLGPKWRKFENPRKIMKMNLLAEEFKPRQRLNLTSNAYEPAQAAVPKYSRAESRVSKVLRPLDQLSGTRRHLYTTRILTRGHRASSQISRYVFEGEQTRESPIRIGIFAGLRGDDEVGPAAVSMFLADLVALPHLGNDLRIYAYPIVSAANFEMGASYCEPSQYIISQTGCETLSSETYQIEREIFAIGFDGVISIQIEDGIENFKVGISDSRLHEALVRPILSSLELFLPNVEDCDGGSSRSLTMGIRFKRRPFELTFRVPSSGWSGLYAMGLRIAIHTAVDCYRSFETQKGWSSDSSVTRALRGKVETEKVRLAEVTG